MAVQSNLHPTVINHSLHECIMYVISECIYELCVEISSFILIVHFLNLYPTVSNQRGHTLFHDHTWIQFLMFRVNNPNIFKRQKKVNLKFQCPPNANQFASLPIPHPPSAVTITYTHSSQKDKRVRNTLQIERAKCKYPRRNSAVVPPFPQLANTTTQQQSQISRARKC